MFTQVCSRTAQVRAIQCRVLQQARAEWREKSATRIAYHGDGGAGLLRCVAAMCYVAAAGEAKRAQGLKSNVRIRTGSWIG